MLKSLTVIATLIAIIGANIISYSVSARLDFTENKIYTLSNSTKNVLSNLNNKIIIKAFISEKLPSQATKIRQDLKDFLDEYVAISNGNLVLEYTDPAKNETDVTLAQSLGVPEVQMQIIEKDQRQVQKAYLGVAILREKKEEKTKKEEKAENTNPLDKYAKYDSIPFVQDLSNFEYNLTAAIMKVNSDQEKIIGFLTGHDEHGLALSEEQRMYMGDKENPRADYPLRDFLSQNYAIKDVTIAKPEGEKLVAKIEGVDTLVIAGPKKALADYEVQAVKDFVASGKNAIFLIDQIDINTQFGLSANRMDESFIPLLNDWGVSIDDSLLKDSFYGQITTQTQQGMFVMRSTQPYPFFVKSYNLNKDNAITSSLDSVLLPWVSPLEITPKDKIKIDILVESSANYEIVESQKMVEVPVKEEKTETTPPVEDKIIKTEEKAKEKLHQAAPVEEKIVDNKIKTEITPTEKVAENKATPPAEVKTAQELRNVPLDITPQNDYNISSEAKKLLPLAVIAQKETQGKVMIVGDSDWLTGQGLSQSEGNLAFFMNAVDSFTLGDELISIRSKLISDRPIKAISETQKNIIKWGNIAFVPLLFVSFGLFRRSLRNARKNVTA